MNYRVEFRHRHRNEYLLPTISCRILKSEIYIEILDMHGWGHLDSNATFLDFAKK
jgi:hypothetical protein